MPFLEIQNLRKEYPGTVALDDVSARFGGGLVHALIGKNGAGKSTLIKILAGAVQPTSGRILLDGRPLSLATPREAFQQGIATVHQELSLVPELTVAENILLGRLPKRPGTAGTVIHWPQTFDRARAILSDLRVDLDPHVKVGGLGVAQQQIVEIAKALSFSPKVLLLDEPTSALALHETESLFRVVRRLAGRGVVVLYITHRLQELREIADTVTVLRDGRCVGTISIEDGTPQNVVRMMFGATTISRRPDDLRPGAEPILEVRGLTRDPWFRDVSFTLGRGEVLGIAGMLGSGRTELLRAIFGADPPETGEVSVGGRTLRRPTPHQARRLGLAMTPEKRKEDGLVQILSTRANLCLAGMDYVARLGVTTRRRETAVASRRVQELQIKTGDLEDAVSSLSGGNQQKVVIGNWLGARPRVILLDEPTRGIDVQAKQQIFQIVWDLSRRGIGSIFVSSELEELLEVCHRILIMKRGRLVGSTTPDTVTLEQLFAMCMED